MSVTLWFSDIEESTRLVQELGEAYPPLPAEHQRVVRDALELLQGSAEGVGYLSKDRVSSCGSSRRR